jgi:tRNA(Arg) A34 adenosine deaminase TadA
MISDSFLQLAIDVAKSSPSKKKIGAVLLRKNKVVTTATNLDRKTHPFQAKLAKQVGLDPKIYLHAEIAALIKAKEEADTMIVARIGGHTQNELRNSCPCPICKTALEISNVKRIIYSTDEGFLLKFPYR